MRAPIGWVSSFWVAPLRTLKFAVTTRDWAGGFVLVAPMWRGRGLRRERMDEPGLMLGSDLVLAWSALKPTRLLGGLIAEGFLGDLVNQAEEASRASARRNPKVASNLETSFKAYRAWFEQLKPALAVAWKRFRAAFPGDQALL